MLILPDVRDVQGAHEDRATQMRREIHRARHPAGRHVRRWIGHQLMRMGARLAAEPTFQPIRSS